MDQTIVVIYHKADFDGIFCREIARKFLPPEARLIGWDYGDPTPEVPPEARLYILDLSVPDLMNHPNLVWIDHHKTAIEKYDAGTNGIRCDGVAACRLAWQWFAGEPGSSKEQYFARTVSEPLAVRLAGEYDIWDKRDPRADLFQHGLRSRELTEGIWKLLLVPEERHGDGAGAKVDVGTVMVEALLAAGAPIQYNKTQENASIIQKNGFTLAFEGLTFLACNASHYNSHLFTAGIRPEHEALLGFCWRGDKWTVSLYGVPHRPDVDLARIAVKHGGGGHKQACGFATRSLPWIGCDHKFIDSRCCLKCGWYPPEVAAATTP